MAAASIRGVWIYGDDVLVFQAAQSLLDHGELTVTAPIDGYPLTRAIPGLDGKRYAKYGPGISVAATPFVALGRTSHIRSWKLPETRDAAGNLRTGPQVWSAGLLGPVALGLLALTTFWLACRCGLTPREAWLAAWLAALASPLTHMAMGLLSEPLSALLLTCALLAAPLGSNRSQARERLAWAVCGCAFGVALTFRVYHLVLLPAILVLPLHRATHERSSLGRLERLVWIAIGPAVALGALAWFNTLRFGHPLETGYGAEAYQFDGPLLRGLLGLTLSWGKGLLWHWPIVLLATLGWRQFRRTQPALSGAVAVGLTCLLLSISSFYQWHGGGVWGPRFLTPLVGWLTVPIVLGWRLLSPYSTFRVLGHLLVAISLTLAWLPQLVPFERHFLRPHPADPNRLEPSEWAFTSAPWLQAARELPAAVSDTVSKLLGLKKLARSPQSVPETLHAPDFAFVRYGSHRLLKRTRSALLLGGTLLIASAVLAWRSSREQNPRDESPRA